MFPHEYVPIDVCSNKFYSWKIEAIASEVNASNDGYEWNRESPHAIWCQVLINDVSFYRIPQYPACHFQFDYDYP